MRAGPFKKTDITTLMSASKYQELVKRIRFLLIAIIVFVFSTHLTVPGVNLEAWQTFLKQGELFAFFGLLTGGALQNFAVTAMGITPYINASIIMQLLTPAIPYLEELQKEGGEEGRRQIAYYTRWLTIALCVMQSTILVMGLARFRGVFKINHPLYYLMVILTLTAGTLFLMWLGEQITDKGIGNGVSILIFLSILLRFPIYLINTFKIYQSSPLQLVIKLGLLLLMFGIMVAMVVVITLAYRKIPINFAQRTFGRRTMAARSSFLPIAVNNAGVLSIIFAISVLYFPGTLLRFLPENMKTNPWVVKLSYHLFNFHSPVHNILYAILIILFTYFYTYIVINVDDLADYLKKSGGTIPGIPPGEPTKRALQRILDRLTLIAGLALALIAILPPFVFEFLNVGSFYLSSTSLLIIVGVIIDTMRQMHAYMLATTPRGLIKG